MRGGQKTYIKKQNKQTQKPGKEDVKKLWKSGRERRAYSRETCLKTERRGRCKIISQRIQKDFRSFETVSCEGEVLQRPCCSRTKRSAMSQAAADGQPGSGKDHGLSFGPSVLVLSGFCLGREQRGIED